MPGPSMPKVIIPVLGEASVGNISPLRSRIFQFYTPLLLLWGRAGRVIPSFISPEERVWVAMLRQ